MPTRFILHERPSLGIVELKEQRFPDRIQHRLGNRWKTSITLFFEFHLCDYHLNVRGTWAPGIASQ
jgi:hypothetical protein